MSSCEKYGFAWVECHACEGLARIGIEGKQDLVKSVMRKLEDVANEASMMAESLRAGKYVVDLFWVPGRVEVMVLPIFDLSSST